MPALHVCVLSYTDPKKSVARSRVKRLSVDSFRGTLRHGRAAGRGDGPPPHDVSRGRLVPRKLGTYPPSMGYAFAFILVSWIPVTFSLGQQNHGPVRGGLSPSAVVLEDGTLAPHPITKHRHSKAATVSKHRTSWLKPSGSEGLLLC